VVASEIVNGKSCAPVAAPVKRRGPCIILFAQSRKYATATKLRSHDLFCKSLPVTALEQLPPAALERVAEYFRALAEPMRLRILNALCAGEMSVGEIAQQVQSSAANVSRHLAQMARYGLVTREGRSHSVYYRIADPTVHALCELVCGSIARNYEQALTERAAFAAGPGGGSGGRRKKAR
jgi:DNA-binding transcriptional ArsR family regulator